RFGHAGTRTRVLRLFRDAVVPFAVARLHPSPRSVARSTEVGLQHVIDEDRGESVRGKSRLEREGEDLGVTCPTTTLPSTPRRRWVDAITAQDAQLAREVV